MRSGALAVGLAALLAGCGAEKRALGPSPPSSAPTSAADPRAPQYLQNAYQISQGGRLFTWAGCEGCHGQEAKGAAKLDDDVWRYGAGVDAVYASIAQGRPGGMPAYARKLPPEELWEIAAYVLDLHKIPAVKRRRQDMDQKAEPQAAQWSGPLT